MNVTAYPLRQVPPLEAQLLHELCGLGRQFELKSTEGLWCRWRFIREPVHCLYSLRLLAGDEPLLLHLAPEGASAFGGRFAPLESITDEVVLAAAVCMLCAPVLDAWEVAWETKLVLEADQSQEGHIHEPYYLGFDLETEDREVALHGVLEMRETLAEKILAHGRAQPARLSRISPMLAARGTLICGDIDLKGNTVAGLKPLSLIFLEEDPRESGVMVIEVPGLFPVPSHAPEDAWGAHFQSLQDHSVWQHADSDLMSDDNFDSSTEAESLASEAQVTLRFTLAEREFSLQDLAQMREGALFEFDQPLNEQVIIEANGREIGRGELVQVGEKPAVLITALKEST